MRAFRSIDEPLTLKFEQYDALTLRARLRSDAAAWGGTRSALSSLGFWATCGYRVAHALHCAGANLPSLLIQVAAQFVFGGDISRKAQIGPSFVVCHPAGVFIGPHCRIGKGCTVGMGVFMGSNMHADDPADYPTIDDRVFVGPTACVMGPVVVGADCRIGPSAVVLTSVPANHIVMPAAVRVVSRQKLRHLTPEPAAVATDREVSVAGVGR